MDSELNPNRVVQQLTELRALTDDAAGAHRVADWLFLSLTRQAASAPGINALAYAKRRITALWQAVAASRRQYLMPNRPLAEVFIASLATIFIAS